MVPELCSKVPGAFLNGVLGLGLDDASLDAKNNKFADFQSRKRSI